MSKPLLVSVCVLFFVGCSDDDGSGGGTGTSGTTETTGALGTSSSSGGGGAPPACTLGGDGCGAGDKCSIVDEVLGNPGGLGCVEAGDAVAFASCDSDTACPSGQFCDHSTSVCKPLCGLDGFACDGGAPCVIGRTSAGDPIPGLNLCVADCNPTSMSESPCGDDPANTCFFRDDAGAFDCATSGNGDWITSCDTGRDCRSGLGCFGGACMDWCSDIGGAGACFGTKADGTWYCNQFMPCGPCVANGYEQGGAPLGTCESDL